MPQQHASPIVEQTRNRHHSVDELLAEVFKVAATAGRQRSVLLAVMMGLTRGGGDITPLEAATEAVNMRGMAIRAAGELGGAALVAVYEYPVDASTRQAEGEAIDRCVDYCMSENTRLRNRFFVADVIRDISGKRMHHTYDWWSTHCDRTIRTLHRWSKSKAIEDRSISVTMKHLVVPALVRVQGILEQRGIEWMDA
jgi:hypothetical protein